LRIYALWDDNWSCYKLHGIKVIGTGENMVGYDYA